MPGKPSISPAGTAGSSNSNAAVGESRPSNCARSASSASAPRTLSAWTVRAVSGPADRIAAATRCPSSGDSPTVSVHGSRPRSCSAATRLMVLRYSGLPPDSSAARRTASGSALPTAPDSKAADSVGVSGRRFSTSPTPGAGDPCRDPPPGSRWVPTMSSGSRLTSRATRPSSRSVAPSAHCRSSRTSNSARPGRACSASASTTWVSAAKAAAAASSAEPYRLWTAPAAIAATAALGAGRSRSARAQGHSGGIPASSSAAPQPTCTSPALAASSSARRVLPIPAAPQRRTTWPAPARAAASRS